MKRQLWVGVMTHVVNQSKKSCLLYCPAISPLGTVVTKRLNVGLTSSLRFASCTRTRSLHQEYFAMHCDEGNGNLDNVILKAQSHDYCPPGPRL